MVERAQLAGKYRAMNYIYKSGILLYWHGKKSKGNH